MSSGLPVCKGFLLDEICYLAYCTTFFFFCWLSVTSEFTSTPTSACDAKFGKQLPMLRRFTPVAQYPTISSDVRVLDPYL